MCKITRIKTGSLSNWLPFKNDYLLPGIFLYSGLLLLTQHLHDDVKPQRLLENVFHDRFRHFSISFDNYLLFGSTYVHFCANLHPYQISEENRRQDKGNQGEVHDPLLRNSP